MQTSKDISVEERAGGVVWITIDRPQKHNALARGVLRDLGQAVAAAGTKPDARFIVLTGAGDRFFAAGGDLVELSSVRDEPATIGMAEQSRAALDAVRSCPVPVLAYLNGDAIGGGAELALACDMRMQAKHARIGFIQARLAISSAWGGGPDLCQLVGGARAMRMMGRGELIDAAQALQWGLADVAVSDGPAGEDVQAFLEPLRACAPQVLRGIKAQTTAWRQGASYEARRAIERQQVLNTWLHEDHWHASDKFLARSAK
ncbi:Enoyl-CoA hydratase/carnithine racemase [Polaromonas sp. OV174]|uniref:enoyl-CoA hydratase/isomerase family protein n=1 Tax=Polaromonas sp. OV174 TaxID=1855300 RepID=UPI0008E8DDE4|nr:enoyl-CoA hydratase/isomerase family protein [Polaromonas sp. OV174]SFC59903.1 Enoyl-CoA hydratase/carnithine racemase [Polaromonas sp. OV174]